MLTRKWWPWRESRKRQQRDPGSSGVGIQLGSPEQPGRDLEQEAQVMARLVAFRW